MGGLIHSMPPFRVVVSCEHASNRLPRRFGSLGLASRHLRSHLAWDPGAAAIARVCARALGCPAHLGRWSRLLVDLNRSVHHSAVVPRQSFGVRIPANEGLSGEDNRRRIRDFHAPYRRAVLADVRRTMRGGGRCLHLSVHSFVPRLRGRTRAFDIGVLYDPARPRERALALRLATELRVQGFRVRLNQPYRGVSDGFTTHCRSQFPASRYLGIEIEVNQGLSRGGDRSASVARRIAVCVGTVLRA